MNGNLLKFEMAVLLMKHDWHRGIANRDAAAPHLSPCPAQLSRAAARVESS